jgi:hypothetical protein
MTDGKSTDILGIAPYGQAVKVVAKGAVDGAGAFLGRICLPAAEELGLLLRDRIANWRRANAVSIAQTAERMLGDASSLHAHPRLVLQILENGSLVDDGTLQEMWSGLLASSCSRDGRDESNLTFVSLLRDLTSSKVRILNYACASAQKKLSPAGWLEAERDTCTAEALIEVTQVTDLHRLDRELDHLRSIGLLTINSGFLVRSEDRIADVTPSPLGLQMYAKCRGHRGSLEEFFGLKGS